ncbi:MAG: radical SAM protein, partial [Acidimicrobiia bacterium]|nr:radical SAM protein [Acidimicrobiia bacterium]
HCRSTEFYLEGKVRDLSLATNRRIADELFLNGVRRVHFLGGEPLVRKDFVRLAKHLKQLGIVWSVNTNGTLLTEQLARRLLDAGACVITVSLDGPDARSNDAVRGRGVFSRVCESIARLTRIRAETRSSARVIISCTVVRQNQRRLGEMVDLAERLGVDNVVFSSLRLMGNARDAGELRSDGTPRLEMARAIAKQLTSSPKCGVQLGFLTPIEIEDLNEDLGGTFPIYDSSCNALVHKGYIQPDGALFPCQALTESANLPSGLGRIERRSLSTESFADIWYSPELQRIRDALHDRRIDKRMLPCRYCKYYRVLCLPCPLGALGGSWSVNQGCLSAMSRMAGRRGLSEVSGRLAELALFGAHRRRTSEHEVEPGANSRDCGTYQTRGGAACRTCRGGCKPPRLRTSLDVPRL